MKHLQQAAETKNQRPVLRANVEICERRLGLVSSCRLGGRGGGQSVALLREDAVCRVTPCAGAQAAIA